MHKKPYNFSVTKFFDLYRGRKKYKYKKAEIKIKDIIIMEYFSVYFCGLLVLN
jgi:hypothetical protein